jgi:hypothetical protein
MNDIVYEYKNNKYRIFAESKVKISGVWVECIIYQTLYDNKDNWIWVRTKKEFFELFKSIK